MGTGVVRSAVAAFIVATAVAGCASPTPAAPVEQVDRQQDGTFALEIRTPKDRYNVGDAVPISTNFMYLGPDARTTVTGSSTLVIFGVKQINGTIDMGGGSDAMCARHELTARQPVNVPFVKSGGYGSDDPQAAFWQAYFADPELHLPAGIWRVTASLEAITGIDCRGQRHLLRAGVTFRVEG